MPIRINLLADALAEEDLRRRDPVKRVIYAGAFLVALSLVWFSSTWLAFVVDKQQLNQVQGRIETLTNEYAQVQSNSKSIADIQMRIDALNQLSRARFLQGNLLNTLQHTYVPNVQLTHVHVEQTYSAVSAPPPRGNSASKLPAAPATITEHLTLSINARDYSPNPGDQVNSFKDALLQQPFFNSRLNGTNGIRLSALSGLQTSAEGKPYVMFGLECRFTDRNP